MVSLCLSRACLDKTIGFSIKWRQRDAVSYLYFGLVGEVMLPIVSLMWKLLESGSHICQPRGITHSPTQRTQLGAS